jgi:hypothetical protein
MNQTLLKARGSFWRDLSNAEVAEIRLQIPKIENDPNYVNYRFFKSPYHKWIILNAMTIPMKTVQRVF